MRLAALGLTIALALAGCGDDAEAPDAGAPAAEQVAAAVEGYSKALVGRDGGEACGFMTKGLQESMLEAMRADPSASRYIEGKTCPQALDFIFDATKGNDDVETALEAVDAIRVKDVKVTGDKATARWTMDVEGQQLDQPAELRHIGGRWLVSCCLGPGAG